MTAYYLQQWEKDGRLIIDKTFPQKAYRVIEERYADCWLAAKKEFGFELTPLQEELLKKFEQRDS